MQSKRKRPKAKTNISNGRRERNLSLLREILLANSFQLPLNKNMGPNDLLSETKEMVIIQKLEEGLLVIIHNNR